MKNRITPVRLIPISFLLAILAGTALLMLPAATAPGETTPPLTALFTAVTSVCVTGLVVVDTYAHWSAFGQFVILVLIQIGGLGVITVASMIMLAGKKKLYLADRMLLRESLNLNVVAERGPKGLWHFVSPKKIITAQTVLLIVVEKKNMAVLQ